MPCWTVRKTTVALEAADPDVLQRGLTAAGFTATRSGDTLLVYRAGQLVAQITDGQARVNRGEESVVNEIKRAYSHEAVRTAAKRFGYTLTTNKQTGKIVAGRRF